MASPKDTNQDPSGAQMPPGSGYIPPQSALVSTGVSAGTGGVAGATSLVLMTLALSQYTGGAESPAVGVASAPHNLPLVAALMVVAIVFAGVALAITALAGRQRGYVAETPIGRLRAYVGLSLFGLAAYGLGMGFLARGLFGSFHVAAIGGAVLQILALAAGIYCRVPVADRRALPSVGLGEPTSKPSPRPITHNG